MSAQLCHHCGQDLVHVDEPCGLGDDPIRFHDPEAVALQAKLNDLRVVLTREKLSRLVADALKDTRAGFIAADAILAIPEVAAVLGVKETGYVPGDDRGMDQD